jgi:hypothetical protein
MYCHWSGVPWLIITGCWIGWLDLLALYYNYLQLQSLVTAYNRWLSKTRSIPSWTTSVFSSTATDLHEWRLSYEWLPADDSSTTVFNGDCPMPDWTEYYNTTDSQSASLSWNKAPGWGLRPEFYYCQTVAGLLMSGALSDETTGLSCTMVNVQYILTELPNELPFITWCGSETEHPLYGSFVLICFSVARGMRVHRNRCPAMVYSSLLCKFRVNGPALCYEGALSEAASSNGPLRLSGGMSQYVYNYVGYSITVIIKGSS